jgi:hypothetical protein
VTPDLSLVRLALDAADDAEARQQPHLAGLLRRLARATLEPRNHDDEVRCGRCGVPLTGRQQQWCSNACRKAALRARSTQSAS